MSFAPCSLNLRIARDLLSFPLIKEAIPQNSIIILHQSLLEIPRQISVNPNTLNSRQAFIQVTEPLICSLLVKVATKNQTKLERTCHELSTSIMCDITQFIEGFLKKRSITVAAKNA